MPIQLVEVIFPDRRDGAWLDGRGLAAASILFIIGSAATWYLWSHVALQRFPAAQGYRSPVLAVALALAVIAVLMALALVRRRSAHAPQVAEWRAPRPWLVGVIAFLLGLVWLALTLTAFDVAPSLNSVIPILLAGFPVAGVLGGPVAVIGKLVLNLLALALLAALALALLAALAVQTRRRWRSAALAPSGLGVPAV